MDHSSKEVAMVQGIEAVPSGLEPVPNHHPHYFYPMPAVAHQTVPAESRICGLRRMTFWLALIVSCLLLVVIGLAVGLGIGLSKLNSTSPAPSPSEAAASSGTSPTPGTPTILSSTSSSTSAATATATSATSKASGNSLPTPTTTVQFDKDTNYTCPNTNNTELQNVSRVNTASADADKSNYHVFCDADINSDDKQDLAAMALSSFADCLGFCNSMNNFQDRADVACTYNFEGTGGQEKGMCWCLAGGSKRIVSNPGNMVAVLTSENVDWQR